MYVLLTIFTGFTVVLSIIFLGNLGKRVGLYQTTLINISVSTIAAILILLFTQKIDLSFINTVPIYLYLGGLLILAITIINSFIITKIPAVYTVILIFIGQMLTGIIIDFFRFGVLPIGDLVGSMIILGGLLYNIRVDKADEERLENE